MKSPEGYLDDQLRGPERPATVSYAEALAAITTALADAERYKNNLVHALRNSSIASPATLAYLDIVAPVPASGTVEVGGRTLPFRTMPSITPVKPPFGEEPPF